jgi:hypothetical protein
VPARVCLCASSRKAGLTQKLSKGSLLERQIGIGSQPTTSNRKDSDRSEKTFGLTVHYNTMRPFSRGYDYGADPALKLLEATGGLRHEPAHVLGNFTKLVASSGSVVLILAGFATFKFFGLILPYATALSA